MHTLKLVVLAGAVVVPELAPVVPELAPVVPELAAVVAEPLAAAVVADDPLFELLPQAAMRATPASAAATCTVLTLNRECLLIENPFGRCRVTVRY
jgi:hypothetical protein